MGPWILLGVGCVAPDAAKVESGAVKVASDAVRVGNPTLNSTRTHACYTPTTQSIEPKQAAPQIQGSGNQTSSRNQMTTNQVTQIGDPWLSRLIAVSSLIQQVMLGGIGYLVFRWVRLRFSTSRQKK